MSSARKKNFNWKARSKKVVTIDNSEISKIKLDQSYIQDNSFDDCNMVVLPSKKRKVKHQTNEVKVTKILSKKMRKQLEKKIEQKKKKENRRQLLEKLQETSVDMGMLDGMVSTHSVHSNFMKLDKRENKKRKRENENEEFKFNPIRGSKKMRRLLMTTVAEKAVSDPNCLGFEDSSESDSCNDVTEENCDIYLRNDIVTSVNESIDPSEQNSSDHKTDVTVTLSDDEKTKSLKNNSETLIKENDNKTSVKINSNKKEKSKTKSNFTKIQNGDSKPAVFVPVNRTPEIQRARNKLPIITEEYAIMEAVKENPVVIIAGETGSGKTTQVPQFLYESGYASSDQMIGITEPRRVAAMSMASRVAKEMNLTSSEVSYLIRFEGNVTANTKIKFMTDGVLLKEIHTDFLLSKYSVVILDEAHERSVYTDILIGLLSRIVPLRNKRKKPLKLIIMSATLRLEDFTQNARLFKQPPPVLKVETRQFPVTIHFNKRTLPDYVNEAYKKVCRIHTQLPEGGILVFVTGQQEVKALVKKLRTKFPVHHNSKLKERNFSDSEESSDTEVKSKKKKKKKKRNLSSLPDINLDDYKIMRDDDTYEEYNDHIEDDDEEEEENIKDDEPSVMHNPLWVLPLYSLLPTNKQRKIFEPPPDGTRLCVITTNVAETSLTIPGVMYVVDTGRVKSKLYDKLTGVSTFNVTWASKAAANQRAGRAGRIGPGHCYRLYSSAVFNDQFPEFSPPEIQMKPVDDLVLQMKSLNITKVVNFPFPSPPDIVQLQAAEKRLIMLGALENMQCNDLNYASKLTDLGKVIASFPVAPRYGKMLAMCQDSDLLQYCICVVAALSVQEVLLNTNNAKLKKLRRNWAGTNNSLLLGDLMVLLRAVGAAQHSHEKGNLIKFCETNGLRHKAVVEIRKLRQQLTTDLNVNAPEVQLCVDPDMKPPTDAQARLLRQIVLTGMPDHVAHKIPDDEVKENPELKHAYRCSELEDHVYLSKSSVLYREAPQWLVFQEIYESTKLYMRGVTAIEPEWLPKFAASCCVLSEPLTDPPPRFDKKQALIFCHIKGTFGRAAWTLPVMEVEFPPGMDATKWFAYFFLKGLVFPKLTKFKKHLLCAPSIIIRNITNLSPRVYMILNTLMSKKVDSKAKLFNQWKEDETYLLSAYQQWLPESLHATVVDLWPPFE